MWAPVIKYYTRNLLHYMYVAIVSSQTFCQSAHDAAAVPNVTKY